MRRKFIIGLFVLVLLVVGVLIVCDLILAHNANDCIYDNVDSILI